jgi:hypothetical protein
MVVEQMFASWINMAWSRWLYYFSHILSVPTDLPTWKQLVSVQAMRKVFWRQFSLPGNRDSRRRDRYVLVYKALCMSLRDLIWACQFLIVELLFDREKTLWRERIKATGKNVKRASGGANIPRQTIRTRREFGAKQSHILNMKIILSVHWLTYRALQVGLFHLVNDWNGDRSHAAVTAWPKVFSNSRADQMPFMKR